MTNSLCIDLRPGKGLKVPKNRAAIKYPHQISTEKDTTTTTKTIMEMREKHTGIYVLRFQAITN